MANPGSEQAGAPGRANDSDKPLWKRLVWFAGLWLAGVGTLFIVASLIRATIL
ncbi:DUF2474 domain-containing protein [Stappia sp.]|jgi:hypothetical protein|uniref:DUF2474 domain-containing protein n=1 Tax=Stappia sp. TaxID=1870903 RepID=UPI003A99CE96